MTRKMWLAFLMAVLAISGAMAQKNNEYKPILNSILNAVNTPDSGYNRLISFSKVYGTASPENMRMLADKLQADAAQTHNEKAICQARVFAGVCFINQALYSDAIHHLSEARLHAAEWQQRYYIDFLLALSYMGNGREDMAAPCLENILSYGLTNNPYSNILYCESLRIMSEFYATIGKHKLSYTFLNEYCMLSDTICGSQMPAPPYILTANIQKKYLERKSVSVAPHSKTLSRNFNPSSQAMADDEEENPGASSSMAWALVVTMGISGIAYKLYRRRKVFQPADPALHKPNYGFGGFHANLKQVINFLDLTQNAVSIIEPNGLITWVNGGFEKLYGYTREEFILAFGDNVFLISEIDGRYVAFERCMIQKRPQTIVTKLRTGYNTEIWINSTITPILEAGKITRYVVVDSDVTQIKNEISDVEMANQQLTASLRNASVIQKLIMPSKNSLDAAFQNFVIFSPKDFVSGDFYWFHQIGEAYYLALGDCTGHGPSASLLSVLCTRSLDDIVLSRKVLDPKEILLSLDQDIIRSLQQRDANNCDGLDITICRILPTQEGANLLMAGAHSYFIYHQDGHTNMIRGVKRSIGGILGFQMKHMFQNNELSLKTGDRFFLTSDGIIDQNNPARKSLGSRRLCDIIQESASKPLPAQKTYIETKLRQWAEGEPQRDDICVIGIQI